MTVATERDREEWTREEWAASTVYARRRARFTRLLTRARRDVAKDLPLTAAEWREIAAVYVEAAQAVPACEESVA